MKFPVSRTFIETCRSVRHTLRRCGSFYRGFTLVETLVAISLLSIAIVAPIGLTVQSLASAYYARDQITAYYLAQEALEAVRQVRDDNILLIAQGSNIDMFQGITIGAPFTIDVRNDNMSDCNGTCPPLKTDGTLYGYDAGMTPTTFTRSVTVCYIQVGGTCDASNPTDEAKVSVTVSWKTGSYQVRTFTISEDMYRWVRDGSGV